MMKLNRGLFARGKSKDRLSNYQFLLQRQRAYKIMAKLACVVKNCAFLIRGNIWVKGANHIIFGGGHGSFFFPR